MNILALSDQADDRVYSQHAYDNYGHVDLVVGCGDLPIYYLEYVADTLDKPVLYVRGNHDGQPELKSDGERRELARGCSLVDDRLWNIGGVTFAGLGGSIKYQRGADQQFSESQMTARILRLAPRLLLARARNGRFIDVVLAHSPPFGIGDLADRAHRGFKAFLTLIKWFRPRYLLHGHVEPWLTPGRRERGYLGTKVVNVNPVYLLDISTEQPTE